MPISISLRCRRTSCLAAFGYNESFAGKEGLPAFRERLTKYLEDVKAKAYNGKTAARVVLVSPDRQRERRRGGGGGSQQR